MTPSRLQAFSLLELLVTLAVAGTLLSIAVPSFSAYLEQNRQTAHVNQMLGAINYARATAITAGTTVSLCAGDGACDNSRRWQDQILIFTDANRNGQLDGSDTLLRINALASDYSWDWSNFRRQKHMSFKSDGTTLSLNGTFTLCQHAQDARRVVINLSGRARSDKPTDEARCTP